MLDYLPWSTEFHLCHTERRGFVHGGHSHKILRKLITENSKSYLLIPSGGQWLHPTFQQQNVDKNFKLNLQMFNFIRQGEKKEVPGVQISGRPVTHGNQNVT